MPQDFSSFAVAPVMDVGDLSEHRGDMFKVGRDLSRFCMGIVEIHLAPRDMFALK